VKTSSAGVLDEETGGKPHLPVASTLHGSALVWFLRPLGPILVVGVGD